MVKMKKFLRIAVALLLTSALLATVPCASAETNSEIRRKLTELGSICAQLSSSYDMSDADAERVEQANGTAAAALGNRNLTDEEGVRTIAEIQSLLKGVEAVSEYGLSVSIDEQDAMKPALFRERFDAQFGESYDARELKRYRELYYHYTSGKMDWVLVYALNVDSVIDDACLWLGNRALTTHYRFNPFDFTCGIYDVQKGRFFDILDAYGSEEYDGIDEALETCKIGRIAGDINADGKLSIADATVLQRCLAGLEDYPCFDMLPETVYGLSEKKTKPAYLTDMNCDGTRDISDVTAIQRILAGLEG